MYDIVAAKMDELARLKKESRVIDDAPFVGIG